MHDSQFAEFGKIYDKLEMVYRTTGGKCCIYSAFGTINREYLYKSCQDVLGSLAWIQQEGRLDIQEKRQATLARQS